MTTNDFISSITANLSDWNIDYTEATDGIKVGSLVAELDEDGSAFMVTDGEKLVVITSDADKAAALLAFPLARQAWEAGYMGDFGVDVCHNDVELTLNCSGGDVALIADVDGSECFTLGEHPLTGESLSMKDMAAVVESAELAYADRREAFQTLCAADDFSHLGWETIVEELLYAARFDHDGQFTKVESAGSDGVALVEDRSDSNPYRVINVDAATDVACWADGDAAAEVLNAIY